MSILHRYQGVGRLGRDPELRYTQSGHAVLGFSVGVDTGYFDRENQWVDRVEWLECAVWGQAAEKIAEGNRFRQGDLVLVEGTPTAGAYMRGDKPVAKLELRVEVLRMVRRKGDLRSAPEGEADAELI